MTPLDADLYLVRAVQAGDERAWREVIERYQGRLLSFSRRMLAQPSEAEDVVQETFLGLMRSLPNYDESRSLETYLFAILRNKLSDQFRRSQRRQRQSLDQLDLNDAPEAWVQRDTPSVHALGREGAAQQRAALVGALREWVEQCESQARFQDLMVVEMLLVLGMRNKEVAADLGLAETAVAGVKFRVLERWKALTLARKAGHDWSEGDLAADSTVAAIWREEGVSCIKRTTLGRFLLGALDDEWNRYVEFHAEVAGCDRCRANLDDLRAEEERDDRESKDRFRERCFASSVGFLSRRPE